MTIKRSARLPIIAAVVLCMFAGAVYWHTARGSATARWKTYCSTSSNTCIKYPPTTATVSSYDVYGTDSTRTNTHDYFGTEINLGRSATASIGFFSALPADYTYNPACVNAPGEKCDFTTTEISNSKIPDVKIIGGIYHVFDSNSSTNTFEPGYFAISNELLEQYGLKQWQTVVTNNFNPTFANTQHSSETQLLNGLSMYNSLAQSKAWLRTSDAQTVKLIVSSLYEHS